MSTIHLSPPLDLSSSWRCNKHICPKRESAPSTTPGVLKLQQHQTHLEVIVQTQFATPVSDSLGLGCGWSACISSKFPGPDAVLWGHPWRNTAPHYFKLIPPIFFQQSIEHLGKWGNPKKINKIRLSGDWESVSTFSNTILSQLPGIIMVLLFIILEYFILYLIPFFFLFSYELNVLFMIISSISLSTCPYSGNNNFSTFPILISLIHWEIIYSGLISNLLCLNSLLWNSVVHLTIFFTSVSYGSTYREGKPQTLCGKS